MASPLLTLGESYAARALMLVASLSGRPLALATTTVAPAVAPAAGTAALRVVCRPGAELEYVAAPGAAPLRQRAAIAAALAAANPALAGAPSPFASAAVFQWLAWADSEEAASASGLAAVEHAAEASAYLAGATFTVADALVYYVINRLWVG